MPPTRPRGETRYATAQRAGRQQLRALILDEASRLLEAEGPEALTMRRISHNLGCSTTVLYTMFGAKAGIADALWTEGFARLTATLENAGGADPLDRLGAIARAYRANALANRSYYAIMFQRPIPGFQPSAQAYQSSLRPLGLLTDAVRACINAGVFRAEEPEHIAGVLWAAAHGGVSLELAGYEGEREAEARFNDLCSATASWYMSHNGPTTRPPPS